MEDSVAPWDIDRTGQNTVIYGLYEDEIVLEPHAQEALDGGHGSLNSFTAMLRNDHWARHPDAMALMLEATSKLWMKLAPTAIGDDEATLQLFIACLETAMTWECG